MNRPEEVLFAGHTHAKIVVVPVLLQVTFLAAHVAVASKLDNVLTFVRLDGVDVVTAWLPVLLHGLLAAAGLWFAVIPLLRWWYARFEVTTRRVRMRWGVLYKHSREIHLDRITQINEERGIIDRLFGAGTIVIHDAANASAIRFHDVPNFAYVRDLLDEARHSARMVETPAAGQPDIGDGIL